MPPADPGAAALQGAVEVVRGVVHAVNEGKREADAFERVGEVQKRLGSSVIIEHPCRRYVAEGEVWQLVDGGDWARRRAILFNDMLLLCRQRRTDDEAFGLRDDIAQAPPLPT
eukprot:1637801-Prymnesium_polylepis.1